MNKVLFHPLGKWRTDLLWRFFGLVIFQSIILQLTKIYTVKNFLSFPLGLKLSFLCGLLLLIFGPRLIILLATTISLYWYLVPFTSYRVELQVAEEYIILLALPTLGSLLIIASLIKKTFLSWGSRPSLLDEDSLQNEIDTVQVCLFRWGAVIVMFFAAFHKLNQDFLNPLYSCGPGLAKILADLWRFPFPDWVLPSQPYQAILAEGLIPFLLLCFPYWGMPVTVLVMGYIGHAGATPFTLIVIVMACAFLQDEDREVIISALKRYGYMLLTLGLVLSAISFKVYTGEKTWFEFHVFQLVFLVLAFLLVNLLLVKRNEALKPLAGFQFLWPKDLLLRMMILIFLGAAVINGMAPYFGWKYRLSFAMLSNLRVDETRWNHLFIPRWFYLKRFDPFIRVQEVKIDAENQKKVRLLKEVYKQGIYPGLFSPMSFKYRLGIYNKLNALIDVTVDYHGKLYTFSDAAHNEDLYQWLKTIPDSKMFQEWLTLKGPQPCLH